MEQPLLPYESCNLGSINLKNFVKEGKIDFNRLTQTINLAVRFLDDVIEVNNYPLPQIKEMTLKTRKIGLGVMGWADMLIKLGIPYDDPRAFTLAKEIMLFIQKTASNASSLLAEERGVFPAWEGSVWEKKGIKRRNATVTTIAPTGSISIIAGASSGIEPLFAVAMRTKRVDTEFIEVDHVFEQIAKERGFWRDSLPQEIIENEGRLTGIKGIPGDIQELFKTARDISPEAHILMQAAFQKFTENAVSKTINLPETATEEDIYNIYLMAYQKGLKGTTIYRDKSRSVQVLNTGNSQTPKTETIRPRSRLKRLTGTTTSYRTGCGGLFVTVNHDDRGIAEVFVATGKHGGCPAQSQAIGRLISVALRAGIDPQVMIDQLKGIRCPSCLRREGVDVLSCPDGVGRDLEEAFKLSEQFKEMGATILLSQNEIQKPIEPKNKNANTCPDCGKELLPDGGCFVCTCGYSKCN